jgi:imidazole glycerol-phosphate synthase subunit HisF
MFRPRIIPVLLLSNKGLVKSIKFRNHRYIGDPINAVKIFNDLKADELVFLDILASKEQRTISPEFVKNVGEEANMPFAAGGGITTLEQIKAIIAAGAEKVVINSFAAHDPDFISAASQTFGSSTIVVCIDVKKTFTGKEQTWVSGGNKPTGLDPVDFAQQIEEKGAGEIIIQSIDRDGTMSGYNLPLVRKVSESVRIPVVALGGAGKAEHLKLAYTVGFASGLAAGSMFVYHGSRNGILINYPSFKEKVQIFDENSY